MEGSAVRRGATLPAAVCGVRQGASDDGGGSERGLVRARAAAAAVDARRD